LAWGGAGNATGSRHGVDHFGPLAAGLKHPLDRLDSRLKLLIGHRLDAALVLDLKLARRQWQFTL
jgi:hypothetical protein